MTSDPSRRCRQQPNGSYLSRSRSLLDRMAGVSEVSFSNALGLGFLYASAYFVRPLGVTGAYLLPSHDVLRLVVIPSFIAIITVALSIYVVSSVIGRWGTSNAVRFCGVLLLSTMTLIGMKALMDAAGVDWQDEIHGQSNLLAAQRYFKVILFFALVAGVYAMRSFLGKLTRFLSSLGFAFGLLALLRLVMLWGLHNSIPLPSDAAIRSIQANSVPSPAKSSIVSQTPRRVVWLLFDETDFSGVYGEAAATRGELKNFVQLARNSVFALHANSPASATLYSIPSLLTGVPTSGKGVQINFAASLAVENPDSHLVPFEENTTIFGALAATGRTSSVLGFYHPYCRLFSLQECDSFTWPEIGGLDAALWENVPGIIADKFGRMDPWYSITEKTLGLLPKYLARKDALTFVHLNFPHLPATYADKLLHVPTSADPLVEYSRNLLFADHILGEIIGNVRRQAATHDVLLIVSTDHWLRQLWFANRVAEASRPVPLIMWKIGESEGIKLVEPVSTVHTSAMILDYLNGNITSQAEIAQWWRDQAFFPSFIAPET